MLNLRPSPSDSSIVRTDRCRSLRTSLTLWVTIVVGMWVVAVTLFVVYKLFA